MYSIVAIKLAKGKYLKMSRKHLENTFINIAILRTNVMDSFKEIRYPSNKIPKRIYKNEYTN